MNANQQAELLSRIIAFRERHGHGARAELRRRSADAVRLVDFIEWKLIEMPLPRVQIVGGTEHRFLYEYHWDQRIKQSTISAYQRGASKAFDNRLLLKPGIAEALIRLNTLIRPLIRREWLAQVQDFNRSRIPASTLERFLFDREREAIAKLGAPLIELQGSRCFYCDSKLSEGHVDHFIPWARYPNNAVENLVVAHERCNNNKRDFLVTSGHVERWADRFNTSAADLRRIAETASMESAPERSLNIASALYRLLPDTALVWREVGAFVPWSGEKSSVGKILAAA